MKSLNVKQFYSICPIDRNLSGATNPGQCGPEKNGSKWVHCISQSSSFTGASPSDCLVSYPWHTQGWGLQRCNQSIQQPQLTGITSYLLAPIWIDIHDIQVIWLSTEESFIWILLDTLLQNQRIGNHWIFSVWCYINLWRWFNIKSCLYIYIYISLVMGVNSPVTQIEILMPLIKE